MSRFGISGIWKKPQTTIPAVIAGLGGVAVALGWCDAESASKYGLIIGSTVIAIIGALHKGKPETIN